MGDDRNGSTSQSRSPADKSAQMARVKSKNTAPEIAVRQALHARGLRFRLHRRDLPGRPDITLPRYRTVIFVHGCYWHGCTMCDRGTRRPKSNTAFWAAKLVENQRRDQTVAEQLHALGWRVLIVWECETRKPEKLAATLDRLLSLVPNESMNDV